MAKKIIGNTVGVPNPQTDFNQQDSTKADYLKNSPADAIERLETAVDDINSGYTMVGLASKADSATFDMEGNEISMHYASKDEVKTVESIAKGANQAISFPNYRTMINALNGIHDPDKYKIGQSVLIETLNVPDLWISDITTVIPDDAHSYTTDEDFVIELKAKGYVWLDMFKLSPLETQKVDLTEYATKAEIDSIKTKKAMFSNGDSIMLDNNKMYYANSEISVLTINYPDGDFISSLEFTLASEGDITITLPESKYIGGVPTFANGEAWELNIKNGVVVGGLVK